LALILQIIIYVLKNRLAEEGLAVWKSRYLLSSCLCCARALRGHQPLLRPRWAGAAVEHPPRLCSTHITHTLLLRLN